MNLYIFKSSVSGLCAFSSDARGDGLPERFGPWKADGEVKSGAQPPHNFSRYRIEAALKQVGFQLWRMKQKAD